MTIGSLAARCAVLLLLLPWAARAPAQDQQPYVLGPNDQVLVSVYGQADKDTRTRIKADGTITLPLVGSVTAAGQSASGLARDVEAHLRRGGYIQNPIVNVEIMEFVSRAVTVLGFVATPGVYPLDRPQTVGTMIARAGGIRDSGSDTIVLRHAHAGTQQRISIAAAAEDAGKDVALQPGDVLYVGEAEHFYIYGQVNAPGTYPVLPGMTLRQALARGGGPTLAGTERRITLYRGPQPAADAVLDSLVRPGDVLLVRERTF